VLRHHAAPPCCAAACAAMLRRAAALQKYLITLLALLHPAALGRSARRLSLTLQCGKPKGSVFSRKPQRTAPVVVVLSISIRRGV
jgi:hypothetical protein